MASEETGIADYDTSAYVCNGFEVTNIYFVYNANDVNEPKKVYKPAYCHQVYNANENIFGYKDLQVNIYYNGFCWRPYLEIKYKEKLKDNTHYGIKADNVMDMLKQWLPEDMCTDKDEFLKQIAHQKSKLLGDIKKKFDFEINSDISKFTVTQITNIEPEFRTLHDKFERVLVWYIDAANLIDLDDPRWTYFYLYEHKNNIVYPIGFCTVYMFFKYPDKNRARISQFFILPSYQRLGLGTKLLEAVYEVFETQENIFDITVEDPSENFRNLRDVMDCKLLSNLPEFSEDIILQKPFYKAAAEVAGKKFKIYSEQAQRVYEILNLYYAGKSDEKLQEWCRRIIARLTASLKKNTCPPRKKKKLEAIVNQIEKINHSADNEIILKRLEIFVEEILPVVHKLRSLNEKEEVIKNIGELKRIWDKMQITFD
ncbi:histone acetyltransferase type B catalytic subunit-like [Agrilus planipennis]|uniref:Histone acetyltransferase type B catalytic subunit n=1 Tax=Agrilus planipennis TaxID=224129 RepID=A0A1W4W474_AGRPL|nr:histone acetyltransferase type B catalytic subunit-like [Agrilus planipennis]